MVSPALRHCDGAHSFAVERPRFARRSPRRWAGKTLTTIVNGQVVLRGCGGLPPVDAWL